MITLYIVCIYKMKKGECIGCVSTLTELATGCYDPFNPALKPVAHINMGDARTPKNI